MGGTMTKVLPSLYIGSLENAKNEEELIANCISHILTVQTTKKELDYKSPTREYLHIYISERDSRSLMRRIPETNTFIHTARSESGNVLVCSESGISASSAVVAAYLMTVYAVDSRSAVSAVQGLRHVAMPIPCLLAQLDRFGAEPEPEQQLREGESEKETAADSLATVFAERQRLKERFGEWPDHEEDSLHLHDAILSFKSLSDSGVLLHNPTDPELGQTTSCSDFEVTSNVSAEPTAQSASTLLPPRRATALSCSGLTLSKDVKLTPPSTPPSTPICFLGDDVSTVEEEKPFQPPSAGQTAVTGTGDISESEMEFPKVGDCSPPVTLNETALFPGDAPIIGIDAFAVDYCRRLAEHPDDNMEEQLADETLSESESPLPYEVGVEVTGDADTDAIWDEIDDEAPGAIEIRTGLVGRRSTPRAAASYHVGLTSRLSPRQRASRRQTEATAAVPVEGHRTSEPAVSRLSTTLPAVRNFLPFFKS